jgi:penicillin-binding protein 1A
MVGGRSYKTSNVNLAVGREGGGKGRQPGSTFKPFLLADIVKQGYSLESAFPAPAELVLPKADAGKDWHVGNYDDESFGTLNMIEATRNSVNTVYAQAEVAVGADHLAETARDLGITAPLRPVASLVLGTVEVSPLDIASAYSTLARRGERIAPQFINTIETADGAVLYRSEPVRTRVLSREQSDMVNTALTQVIERGTGAGARLKGAPPNTLIGKTGTTQDYGDAWFVGSTTTLTTAVWMGYPEGNARTLERFRGGKPVTGGTVPAEIWKRFMNAVTKGQTLTAFPTVTKFPGRVLGTSRSSYRVPAPTTTAGGDAATDPNVTTATTRGHSSTSTTQPNGPPTSDGSPTPSTTPSYEQGVAPG